jgi:protein-S-isoprenylcysteine O-methyltransferase Ste14
MGYIKTIPVKIFVLFLFVGLPLFFNPEMPDVNASTSVMACGFTVLCTSLFFAFHFSKKYMLNFSFCRHPIFFLFTILTFITGLSMTNSINPEMLCLSGYGLYCC